MVFGLPAYLEIFLLSVLLAFVMTLTSRLLANQQEIRKAKKEMEFYREKVSRAQKDRDTRKMNEYMSEMNKASMRQLRLNMKPMMLSFLIVIAVAGWFGVTYAQAQIISPVPIPLIGSELNWFWWYVLTVLPFSTVFRKLLNVS